VRSVKEEHNVTQCSQNLKIALQIISNITDNVPKKKEQTLMLFRLGKMGRKREGKKGFGERRKLIFLLHAWSAKRGKDENPIFLFFLLMGGEEGNSMLSRLL
jgi:hypothetical protein